MSAFIALLSLTMGAPTNTLTDQEQLYVKMLIQQRDGRAGVLKRCIQSCETVLKNRKHRTAASRGAEPTRVSLGGGRYYDLDDTTSRKEIESLIKSFKQELELVETGATIPDDRFWDPNYNNTLGLLGGDIRVLQVIGPSDMMITSKAYAIVWIEGYSTNKLADDQPVKPDGVFVAVGTKSYTNTIGVKSTVRLLRPVVIDREKVIAEFRAQSKASAPLVKEVNRKLIRKANVDNSTLDPEAAARKRFAGVLTNARALAKAGLRDAAEKNLRRIIKEAPSTAIAKEAEQELDQLGNGR